MSKPRKIAALEALAREIVGDGKGPDLFFVTDQGVVVTITRDYELGYRQWQELSRRSPRVESALENRQFGVLCSVAPESDEPGARLIVLDDSAMFRKRASRKAQDGNIATG